MPLNIFEPRYLAMIDDALRSHRIIGMIQPDAEGMETARAAPPLYGVGCIGGSPSSPRPAMAATS